jgi:hypothetical protein
MKIGLQESIDTDELWEFLHEHIVGKEFGG